MQPLHATGKRSGAASLPVAALPCLKGADCFIANRAKRRPCLVLGAVDNRPIHSELISGMSKSHTHEFFLVAPYFTVAQEARSGYNPQFVDRIRHAEYSRFFWERLPGKSGHESILRFDQIQPVGVHHQAHEHSGYRMTCAALSLTDEWLLWLLHGGKGKNLCNFSEIVQDVGEKAGV